jgi:hypothetical protein
MVLDLNLYKGFITNSIFYLDAKVIDNIDAEIKISFFNLVIYPNPITLGLNVAFSYKRNGGFINYTCDNINYQNLANNNFNLILKCNKISGGIFEQDNLLNSYLVIDNSNNYYEHALENLLYSKFYFQINKEIIPFDGNLFQTNIGNVSLYIDDIVNSKIVNLSGDKVEQALNKINYSLLNITNKPTFKYQLINNSSNKKVYEIVIQFLGTSIDELSESTINLLKDELFNTLFYELDLVFYLIIDKIPQKNSLITGNTTTTTPTKLCIKSTPSNTIKTFPYTPTSYSYNFGNIYVGKGMTLYFKNKTKTKTKTTIYLINGINNYGTINFDSDVIIEESIDKDNVCPNYNIQDKFANYGTINMNGNSLSGYTLNPKGTINS